jgi:PIN domain nuclease of toxin-antitoxin system
MIVLDTSALLFWTLDPLQLSPKAARAIVYADRVVVSSISIWEIALKVQRKKLSIPLAINDYVERLEAVENLAILPVDVGTWQENVALAWEHRDPADRTIVALAVRYNCPLVTSDGVVAEFYPQTIW